MARRRGRRGEEGAKEEENRSQNCGSAHKNREIAGAFVSFLVQLTTLEFRLDAASIVERRALPLHLSWIPGS